MFVYDGDGPSGGPSVYTIPGFGVNSSGGAQFVGFTEPDAGITKVSFQLTGFTSTSRDIIGLDGITFVTPVPEPSTLALFTLGGLGLLASRRAARRAGA